MSDPSLVHTQILDGTTVEQALDRMAGEILARHPTLPLALVGIHRRGVILADRLYQRLQTERSDVARGTIDISLYRDDLDNLGTIPMIQGSDIPFPVEGSTIVLCDDVLYTGRTIRAAIDVLIDYGRPNRIELAVLVDRGNRELPIAPDYTGQALQTDKDEHIRVCFSESDGDEGVYQVIGKEAS